jgi:AraC-like DNA-binding protein
MTAAAGHGLWIPAGLVHAGRLTAGVLLCDAFFTPEACPVEFDGPTVIEVTPVLESLLIRLAHDDLDPAQRARTEAVVFDVLAPAPRQFALRVPGDARVDRIAQALLDDPGDPRSAEDWARETGLSTRTISRAFLAGTGLSFGRWRQALRIQTALTLLAEGTSVKDTADLLGYAQTSTFIESFRRAVGTTPGTFVSENPYPAS